MTSEPALSTNSDGNIPGGGEIDGKEAVLLRLSRLTGIDFHILQTLLLRGWSIIAGAVMVFLVPHWFSADEQGYYYTFLGLIAVQILFELGINQIIVQLVSHEAAHLRPLSDGSLSGRRRSITRLASLVSLITRWYRIAALTFFLCAGAGGLVFFGLQHHLRGATVAVSWLALVFFTSINLYLSPALAVLEGLGRVGNVARLRFTQSVFGYATTWVALSFGAGLFAAPVLAAVAVACTAYWLARHDRRVRWLRAIEVSGHDETMSWRRDVFPLQWRVALSWISGYLILQLLVPVTFINQGAAAAGKLGLTLTIFNSILSVGLSWVNARMPTIANRIARGEHDAARSIFRGIALRSIAATAAGCAAVSGGVLVLPRAMQERLADLPGILSLSVAMVVSCLIYALASFVRAHKEEPFVVQSLATAAVMAPAIYRASVLSSTAITATFAAILSFLALPWVSRIFLRYYSRRG